MWSVKILIDYIYGIQINTLVYILKVMAYKFISKLFKYHTNDNADIFISKRNKVSKIVYCIQLYS